jgi:hypothetical protein
MTRDPVPFTPTIPKVVVTRAAGGTQRVFKVTIDGNDVRAYSVSVHRSVDGPPMVTLVMPAEYLEVDPE